MFDFNSTLYKEYLKDFRNNTEESRIIIFAGNFAENRKYALTQFETETLGETKKVFLSEFISESEKVSYEKLDALFEELKTVNSLVVFKEAEQLCGIYVGHTYSVVKYATPQEKYFIEKLKDLKCSSIIEFENEDHLDKTLERVADAVVRFRVPSSRLEKIFFWLTQVRVHGSNLPSRRPA